MRGESLKLSTAPSPPSCSPQDGCGPSATVAFKRLASIMWDKLVQPYSRTLGFIWCKIAFSLLDSAIMCLRGARSSFHIPAHNTDGQDQPLDLVANAARLSDWSSYLNSYKCLLPLDTLSLSSVLLSSLLCINIIIGSVHVCLVVMDLKVKKLRIQTWDPRIVSQLG